MRPDIERQALVDNPYSGNEQHRAAQMVADKLYRIVVIGGSLYFLHTWQVYATILRSPKMHHEWFKVGLAASVGEWNMSKYARSLIQTSFLKRNYILSMSRPPIHKSLCGNVCGKIEEEKGKLREFPPIDTCCDPFYPSLVSCISRRALACLRLEDSRHHDPCGIRSAVAVLSIGANLRPEYCRFRHTRIY